MNKNTITAFFLGLFILISGCNGPIQKNSYTQIDSGSSKAESEVTNLELSSKPAINNNTISRDISPEDYLLTELNSDLAGKIEFIQIPGDSFHEEEWHPYSSNTNIRFKGIVYNEFTTKKNGCIKIALLNDSTLQYCNDSKDSISFWVKSYVQEWKVLFLVKKTGQQREIVWINRISGKSTIIPAIEELSPFDGFFVNCENPGEGNALSLYKIEDGMPVLFWSIPQNELFWLKCSNWQQENELLIFQFFEDDINNNRIKIYKLMIL